MKKNHLVFFIFLAAAETLGFGLNLAAKISSGAGTRSVFWQIDLGLLAVLSVIFLGSIWALVSLYRKEAMPAWIQKIETSPAAYWTALIVSALVLYEAIQDLLFFRAGLKEVYYPVSLASNQPLFLWAALISGQALVGLALLGTRKGYFLVLRDREKALWVAAGVIIGLVVLASGSGGSLPTNAPVPFLHLLIAAAIVITGVVVFRIASRKMGGIQHLLGSDVLVLVVLWLAAFFLWSQAQIEPNYFIDVPRPPNYTYSPTSDAIYYEIQSQRFLAGLGFDDNAQHSLYGYFLSGLHALAGEGYLDVYKWQIAVLALIPFLLFKLTYQLGSRTAGWLAGILFIIREHTALLLGDTITVSNVQVLMTEPLATLGVILILYLGVIWLQDRGQKKGLPFLIGGLIGLVVLTRIELFSLLLALAAVGFVVRIKDLRGWLGGILAMGLALGLAISPWILRNYAKTNQVTLDKRVVIQWVIDRYSAPENAPSQGAGEAGEDSEGLLAKMNLRNLELIGIHTGSSLQQALLYLPSNHLPFGSLDTFLKIVPEKRRVYLFQEGFFSDGYATSYTKSLPYWDVPSRWGGRISARSYLPMVLVLVFLALGLYGAWKRFRWIGFFPLLVMVLHVVIYAFFIGSGGRYIQVVDWISLLYLCLGLSQPISWAAGKIAGRFGTGEGFEPLAQGQVRPAALVGHQSWLGFLGGALCIAIGISLPLVEASIPVRYTEETLLTDLQLLADDPAGSDIAAVEELARGQTAPQVIFGKALYPNYFEADEWILDDRYGKIPPAGISRTVFALVGTKVIWVSLPSSSAPDLFPHGSEVIVVGEIVRDSPEDLKMHLRPYFAASEIYILPDPRSDRTLIRLISTSEPHSD